MLVIFIRFCYVLLVWDCVCNDWLFEVCLIVFSLPGCFKRVDWALTV